MKTVPALKVLSTGEKYGLTLVQQQALLFFARERYALELNGAPSLLASDLCMSIADANDCLLALLGTALIRQVPGAPPRLEADFAKLGLSSDEKEELQTTRPTFDNYGPPHSEGGMESLRNFFERESGTIYLGLEATSHKVFPFLSQRARNGLRTVFLMPKRKDVQSEKQNHYDEVLEDWLKFLKNGDKTLRDNVEILLTAKSFPDIYTTALSSKMGRLNAREMSAKNTRAGIILEANAESSIYQLLRSRYEYAITGAHAPWRYRPRRALIFWLRRLLVPIMLLIVGLTLAKITNNPFWVAISGMLLGLLVELTGNSIGAEQWFKSKLFQK